MRQHEIAVLLVERSFRKVAYFKIHAFNLKLGPRDTGVGRMFSRGSQGDFSKIFLGGAKSGDIYIFPLNTKKITFFW